MKRESPSKATVRRARCNQVLVILNNRLEMVELVREEIHPGVGKFDDGRLEFGVVRWHGWEVYVVLECMVFLREPPPEPLWMQEARAKVEQELASRFNQEVKGSVPAERPRPLGRASRQQASGETGGKVDRKGQVKHNYLNEFHRSHSELLKKHLSMQPKASLEDAMKQYKRIKRGSSRNQRRVQQNGRSAVQSPKSANPNRSA